LTKNSRSCLGLSAKNAYPTDSRGSTAVARASCTEATVIRMSIIGFALMPGIAVLGEDQTWRQDRLHLCGLEFEPLRPFRIVFNNLYLIHKELGSICWRLTP
jgi:hypothetical protein